MLGQSRGVLAAAADQALLGRCAAVDQASPFASLAELLIKTSVADYLAARDDREKPALARTVPFYASCGPCSTASFSTAARLRRHG